MSLIRIFWQSRSYEKRKPFQCIKLIVCIEINELLHLKWDKNEKERKTRRRNNWIPNELSIIHYMYFNWSINLKLKHIYNRSIRLHLALNNKMKCVQYSYVLSLPWNTPSNIIATFIWIEFFFVLLLLFFSDQYEPKRAIDQPIDAHNWTDIFGFISMSIST